MPATAGIRNPKKRNGTTWRKGQSGNPKGAMLSQQTRAQWRECIDRVVQSRFSDADVVAMLEAMQKAGLAGDVSAATLWLDRVLGKVETKIDLSVKRDVDPDRIRAAIETLTRLGFGSMVPPSFAVVAESPVLPTPLAQDQSEIDPPGNATESVRVDPGAS